MNRGTRTLLVLAIALALAGAASFAVYRAIKSIPVREVEIAKTYFVVAAKALPVGTLVEKAQVKLVAWPAASPVPGGFSNPDEVVGRGLVQSVAENEPITSTKLAPRESGAGLPPTIPPGLRALSVKVNEIIGVAGFVVPGTHVDVVATMGSQSESITRTVVSNVLVLAAGTRYDQEDPKRDGKPIPTTVVTVAVTPPDAERITMAQAEGKVMLALRNPLDTLPTETTGVRLAGLMGPPAPPPVERTVRGRTTAVAAKPPAPPPAPKPYTVEAIRGAKRTEETVK